VAQSVSADFAIALQRLPGLLRDCVRQAFVHCGFRGDALRAKRHGICLALRGNAAFVTETFMNVSSSTSLNPALATMLAQLTPSNSGTMAMPPPTPDASGASPSAGVGTGSGKAQVSDAILDLFSKMHQASGGAHQGGGAGASSGTSGSTTAASTASTMIDPLSQLMAAIGIDEDEPAGDTEPDLSMFYSSNNASAS
jgi:hypothetical protein